MSTPRVSIVMPVRNGAAHLRDAVQSVLLQTMPDFELIIVDNGSDDGTAAILRSLDDARIRIHTFAENRGLPAARNTAVAMAQGALIAMMDADDIALPRRLERQCALLDADASIGVCGVWMRTLGARPEHVFRFETSHEAIVCELLFDSHLSHGASMMRAELLRGFDPPYPEGVDIAEDYNLWTRLSSLTRFSAVPEVLYRYRMHPSQVSVQRAAAQAAESQRIHTRLLTALGAPTDGAALDLHTAISRWALPRDLSALDAAHAWFERLLAANENSGVYQSDVLHTQLAKRFFFLCNLFIYCGPTVLPHLGRYPLHRQAKVPNMQRLRQRMKALLRIDVRGRSAGGAS
jgi:glycosyltransferase involved in cell wall biosynthesis